MGIVFDERIRCFMLEIIEVIAKVVGAIMSTGCFVLRLLEYLKHKKSNRPDQG